MDLTNAMEKLKQMMSTDEGQVGIQNFISNLKNGEAEDSGDFIPVEPKEGAQYSFDNDTAEASSPPGDIDMGKIMKMFSNMNSGSHDAGGGSGGGKAARHAAMLSSLKPYLSDGRRGKLDMASKLMSLAKFAPLMKDIM